jgi:23S rRNA U2552 (ribose-2'-O)-methylase RlmE/FtsJ
MVDIKKFKEQGYVIIPNCISNNIIEDCKQICLSIRNSSEKQVISVASFLSPELFRYYTSDFMYDIASELLETDEVYLFNDQVVIKLPNEDFKFEKHTDNAYGPHNELAVKGEFKTITCAWVLDDFTEQNGPVAILNTQTNEWDIPLPKKGDMIIWDGNTLHESSINKSNKERAVWLCVYSTHDLTSIKPFNSEFFKNKNFYSDRFVKGKMLPFTSTYKNKYTAQQTEGVWKLFEEFLLKEKFERIFEIGTALGGLTQFIDDFSKENNIDTEIVSIDVKPINQFLTEQGIQNLQMNALDIKNISKLESFLKTDKKLLILCDGNEKPTEFNLYSKYIKVGDFIMAHDYSVSYEYFENNIKNKKWDWCQITEGDIIDVSTKLNLVDYTNLNFIEEMWVCKTKKENTKKTLL